MDELVEKKLKDVIDIIDEIKDVFVEKTKEYKRTEVDHGEILKVLFPEGLEINPEDFSRWMIYNLILMKAIRYGKNFKKGHYDSLKDLAIYTLMLMSEDNRQGVNK